MVNQTNGHGVNQAFLSLYPRPSTGTYTEQNTTWTTTSAAVPAGPNEFRSSGKWYCEATCGTVGFSLRIGIAPSSYAWNSHLGFSGSGTYGWSNASGNIIFNDGTTATYATYTTNDVVAVAFDLTNNRLYFRKNGVWQNSADPSNNIGGISISAGSWCPAISAGSGGGSGTSSFIKVNFGQWPLIYAPPNGFSLFS
jgi:hypothetical protein